VALLDSELTGYGEYANEGDIWECIDCGLLKRDGQHVELTQLAHDTYDAGYTEPEMMKEAA
jgi:hypothetical protein